MDKKRTKQKCMIEILFLFSKHKYIINKTINKEIEQDPKADLVLVGVYKKHLTNFQVHLFFYGNVDCCK